MADPRGTEGGTVDRRYRQARIELERALKGPEALHDLDVALNDLWRIAPVIRGSGVMARIATFVWRILGLTRRRQRHFNSAVVRHINRTRETREAVNRALLTYIDASLADERAVRLRMLDEIQSRLGILQHASLSLKRELEHLLSAAPISAAGGQAEVALSGDGGPEGQPTTRPAGGAAPGVGPKLDAYKYVGFEDEFRGSQADIRGRLADYLPYFAGTSDVLDVGCGRGEFLELLRTDGILARGIDLNRQMVEICRERGLEAVEGDVLTYLPSVADSSLGGLFAAQLVEHLQPDALVRLLETAHHKLRRGAKIVLETINPACWGAFFDSYLRDITHVRPLHPDTLAYLLRASGFQNVDVRYSAPYPPEARLQRIAIPTRPPDAPAEFQRLEEFIGTFNANVERLNGLLFACRDYAVIGERP